mgnify:FL=1
MLVFSESTTIKGKTVTKVVENIGYLEDLTGNGPGQYPDPIAHFRKVAKQRTLDRKQGKEKLTLTYSATESLSLDDDNCKNIVKHCSNEPKSHRKNSIRSMWQANSATT